MTPYHYDEVQIFPASKYLEEDDRDLEDATNLKALREAAPYLIEQRNKKNGKHFDSFPIPRLEKIISHGETSENKRGPLELYLGQTCFYDLFATNSSLDYSVIPASGYLSGLFKKQTIRDAFVSSPYLEKLASSRLANPLGVNVVVLSRNLNQTPNVQVIIRLRSQNVAAYRNWYQVGAAGFLVNAHHVNDSLPNPFVAAITEAQEEIADSLQLTPADFKLIGISLTWEEMFLSAYGFIETGLLAADLIADFRRDDFEGYPEAIPFTPKAVITHLASHKWDPISVHAMCAVLLAHFSHEEVEAVAKQVSAKDFREYYREND